MKTLLYLFIAAILFSCKNKQAKQTDEKITFSDDLRRVIVLNKKPAKIMALAPSVTEMLFFVVPDSQIVAVTKNDNFPPQVASKKMINTFPAVDYESVLQVKPDLIFSLEGMTPPDQVKKLESLGMPVYFQRFETVADILKGIRAIGKIMNYEQKANRLADSLEYIRQQVLQETKNLPRPKVLAITWNTPIYVYGKNTIFTDKVHIAGAENAVDSVFKVPYPELTREYILKINPDIIVGNSFEKMDTSFFRLYPELKRTKAYQNKHIYLLTDDLHSRPSPRVMEAILELKNIIHPPKP
ncbi:MAG: ABC transporter substrate-binding protein [Verrucomicrobia bacterium]|nr:ABC transporter substrate-binding protein [Cytophagales bacterium]